MDPDGGSGFLPPKTRANTDETVDASHLQEKDVRFANATTVKEARKPVEPLAKKIERAGEVKQATLTAMTSMFQRVAQNGSVGVQEARETVSPMIDSIVDDPRALLSLVNLKNADNYTFMHSVNVTILALSLTVYLGAPREVLDELGVGALMHDIGKTHTPIAVLHKPAPLSDHEMTIMRRHPVEGARILTASGGYSELALSIVLDHHEDISGNGYPCGKRGGDISVCAQITSIADIYDALTTERPYRRALSHMEALTLMKNNFVASLNQGYLSHFMAMLGRYPIGTVVELTNGCSARVVETDSSLPPQPSIMQITRMPDGSQPTQPLIFDLSVQKNVSIRHARCVEVLDDAIQVATREYKPFLAAA